MEPTPTTASSPIPQQWWDQDNANNINPAGSNVGSSYENSNHMYNNGSAYSYNNATMYQQPDYNQMYQQQPPMQPHQQQMGYNYNAYNQQPPLVTMEQQQAGWYGQQTHAQTHQGMNLAAYPGTASDIPVSSGVYNRYGGEDHTMGATASATARPQSPTSAGNQVNATGLVRLTLRKPMGIVFEPMTHNGAQRGVRICDLPRTGAAAMTGKLQVGDELLSINDKTMSRLTFDEIMDFIIDADADQVNLLFRRPKKDAFETSKNQEPSNKASSSGRGIKWAENDEVVDLHEVERREESRWREEKESSRSKDRRRRKDEVSVSSRSIKSNRGNSRKKNKNKYGREVESESFLDMLIDNLCFAQDSCDTRRDRDDDDTYYDDDTYADDETYDDTRTYTSADESTVDSRRRKERNRRSRDRDDDYSIDDDATLETLDTYDKPISSSKKSTGGPPTPLGMASVKKRLSPVKEGAVSGDDPAPASIQNHKYTEESFGLDIPLNDVEYDDKEEDVAEEDMSESVLTMPTLDGVSAHISPLARELGQDSGFRVEPGLSFEQTVIKDPKGFYKHVVLYLLQKNEPSKLKLIDKLMSKYADREEHLIQKLTKRYEKEEKFTTPSIKEEDENEYDYNNDDQAGTAGTVVSDMSLGSLATEAATDKAKEKFRSRKALEPLNESEVTGDTVGAVILEGDEEEEEEENDQPTFVDQNGDTTNLDMSSARITYDQEEDERPLDQSYSKESASSSKGSRKRNKSAGATRDSGHQAYQSYDYEENEHHEGNEASQEESYDQNVIDADEEDDESGSYSGSDYSSVDGTSPAVIAQVSELLNFVYGKTSVPGQIDRVSTIMRAYEGREQVLLELLETKALIKANSVKDQNDAEQPPERIAARMQSEHTQDHDEISDVSNTSSKFAKQPPPPVSAPPSKQSFNESNFGNFANFDQPSATAPPPDSKKSNIPNPFVIKHDIHLQPLEKKKKKGFLSMFKKGDKKNKKKNSKAKV